MLGSAILSGNVMLDEPARKSGRVHWFSGHKLWFMPFCLPFMALFLNLGSMGMGVFMSDCPDQSPESAQKPKQGSNP